MNIFVEIKKCLYASNLKPAKGQIFALGKKPSLASLSTVNGRSSAGGQGEMPEELILLPSSVILPGKDPDIEFRDDNISDSEPRKDENKSTVISNPDKSTEKI